LDFALKSGKKLNFVGGGGGGEGVGGGGGGGVSGFWVGKIGTSPPPERAGDGTTL